MELKHVRQLTGRYSRESSDDFEHEALRSRNAEATFHQFGCALQSVLDGPEEAHEIEHRFESRLANGVRR